MVRYRRVAASIYYWLAHVCPKCPIISLFFFFFLFFLCLLSQHYNRQLGEKNEKFSGSGSKIFFIDFRASLEKSKRKRERRLNVFQLTKRNFWEQLARCGTNGLVAIVVVIGQVFLPHYIRQSAQSLLLHRVSKLSATLGSSFFL